MLGAEEGLMQTYSRCNVLLRGHCDEMVLLKCCVGTLRTTGGVNGSIDTFQVKSSRSREATEICLG